MFIWVGNEHEWRDRGELRGGGIRPKNQMRRAQRTFTWVRNCGKKCFLPAKVEEISSLERTNNWGLKLNEFFFYL